MGAKDDVFYIMCILPRRPHGPQLLGYILQHQHQQTTPRKCLSSPVAFNPTRPVKEALQASDGCDCDCGFIFVNLRYSCCRAKSLMPSLPTTPQQKHLRTTNRALRPDCRRRYQAFWRRLQVRLGVLRLHFRQNLRHQSDAP